MPAARSHRSFGAVLGWWSTAARALALVLALAMAAPSAGMASDLAYHQGHHGHGRTELAVASDEGAAADRAADPGVHSHLHCGCHLAVSPHGTTASTPVMASRLSYARLAASVRSVFPDRLPRPPRA